MDITLSHNISFTKKEKAINPNAKCPAMAAIVISSIPVQLNTLHL